MNFPWSQTKTHQCRWEAIKSNWENKGLDVEMWLNWGASKRIPCSGLSLGRSIANTHLGKTRPIWLEWRGLHTFRTDDEVGKLGGQSCMANEGLNFILKATESNRMFWRRTSWAKQCLGWGVSKLNKHFYLPCRAGPNKNLPNFISKISPWI